MKIIWQKLISDILQTVSFFVFFKLFTKNIFPGIVLISNRFFGFILICGT